MFVCFKQINSLNKILNRYDSQHLILTHKKAKRGQEFINDGIDITNYTKSVEWDVINSMAHLNSIPPNAQDEDFYPGYS